MKLSKIKQSIGMRFILISVLSLAALVFISYIFSAWYMVNSTEKKILKDYEGALEFTTKQIRRYQKDIIQYSTLIVADNELQKLLNETDQLSEREKIRRLHKVHEILRDYKLLRDECIGIEIIMENGDVYTSDTSDKTSLHLSGEDSWYYEIIDCNKKRDFSQAHDLYMMDRKYEGVVTYSCDIGNYYANKKKVGKLLLHIRKEAFDTLVYETNSELDWCAILSSEKKVLAESGEKRQVIETYLKSAGFLEGESQIRSENDGWILYDNQMECDLWLVMYMSKERLRDEERNIFLFFLLLFAVCLSVSVIAMVPISKSLSNPIKALSNAARQISEGQLNVHIQAENSDEIGTLTEIFNQMVISLEKQMQDLKASERDKADLKMSILMSQINPHFIYNTLDSVIYLSRVGEARKAEKLLQLFILLLQNNMKEGMDSIVTTLGEEIQDVRTYIELQKIRYPDRFAFRTDIDESLNQRAIPRLILQPLIENALNHGVLSKDYGIINLKIYSEQGWLTFILQDDGEGMEEQRVKDILIKRDEKNRRHAARIHSISISNICQRLELMYHDEYCFEIRSELGKGTEIFMSFPLEFGNKKERNTFDEENNKSENKTKKLVTG